MAKPLSLKIGGINLTAGEPGAPSVPREDTPFRMLVLGNFSGGQRPATPLAQRRPVRVDRDNLDEVLARLGVRAHVAAAPGSASLLPISFRELDDFHPDRLYEGLETFEALRDLRRRLENPSTFAAAAAEVRGWAGAPAPEAAVPAEARPTEGYGGDVMAELLAASEAARAQTPPQSPAGDWKAFLRQIVAPHLAAETGPDQAELIARVDEATGAHMRAILHHPAFQAVEAAWRGLFLLTRRLDTDEGLQLFLLDASKEELAADLGAPEDLRTSGSYKLLVEQAVGTSGAAPWAVFVGNYTFGPTAEDALLLARLGLVAQSAGAPFVAAAESRLFGCASLAAAPDPDDWQDSASPEAWPVWEALRRAPQAAYLGLAAPRFLLRLPYGASGGTLERFDFEEMPDGSRHDDYLWGNPAFAVALLLGRAFNHTGWSLPSGLLQEIEGLPAHVYEEDGEKCLKPCAEVLLTDRALEHILEAGVMPLLSVQGRDLARLARLQSLAEPPQPLAGRWQSAAE
jgi:type VI secretion system protein ImpC